MKHTLLTLSALVLAPLATVSAAEPLAQGYVVVHRVRDLDDPAKAVCVGSPDIVQRLDRRDRRRGYRMVTMRRE